MRIKNIKSLYILIFCFLTFSLFAESQEELLANINEQPDSLKIKIYNKLSKQYQNTNLSTSLKYATKAESLALETSHSLGLANSLRNIGTVYFQSSDYDKSLEFYQKSLEIGLESNNYLVIGKAYNNIGMVKKKLRKYSEALESYKLAEKYERKANYTQGMVAIYNNIATLYKKPPLSNYQKSLFYRKKALNYISKDEFFELAMLHKNIASTYYYLKDYDKSLEYLNLSTEYSKDRGFQKLEIEQLWSYTMTYIRMNNTKDAIKYQIKWRSKIESYFSDKNSDKLEKLKIEYDVKAKNNQIVNLQKLQSINDEQLKKEKLYRKNLIILFIAILILVVISFIFGLSNYKTNILLKEKNSLLSETIEELEEANSTKNRFFSIIAHDLRNPFTSIYSAADFLNSFYGDLSDFEKRDSIAHLKKASERILTLINDLFEWSKSQTNRIEFKQEELQIYEIIESQINIVNESARIKDIKIYNNLDKNLEVFADKNMITTIVRNLLSNAVKFTPTKGEVHISSDNSHKKIPKNHIILSIEDNGVGIPENVLPNLFRIDNKHSTKGTNNEVGSGLGLLLCKDFIEKHDGVIGVESKIDIGTKFYFSIPLSK